MSALEAKRRLSLHWDDHSFTIVLGQLFVHVSMVYALPCSVPHR